MLVSGPLAVPLARPVATDTVTPRPLRVSSVPAYRTYDGGQRRTVRRGRSWKKSAVIIGGSTAAGAGVGAVLGGGSGAKKGAVAGLLGGTIYDLATRTH